jgi:FixJ family two-component response regulator
MASETMDESPRISIVDDDDSVRRALGRLCKSAGYRVESYGTAEAFLEAPGLDETDCLILDVHLPGRSGLQLQRELQIAGRRFPIVFVTAYEDERAQMQALESGAFDFLHKPIDSERLLDVIRRAIHHRV